MAPSRPAAAATLRPSTARPPPSSPSRWARSRRRSNPFLAACGPGAPGPQAVFRMHRYLVSFDPKRVAHQFADILVIGGGIAGLRAALEVPPDLEVLVVTKDKVRESNSTYAQGGIASVL